MNFRFILVIVSLIFFQWCTVASAQTPPESENAQNLDTPTPPPTDVATKVSKMPRLLVKWSCDSCEINPKVIPLLDEGYTKEVFKNGQTIANDEIAEAVIVEFRQRNPANRSLFGAFAGKDILGLKIMYKGKELLARDYYANAWQGMNALCESVAQISYQKIAEVNAQ